MNIAAVQRFSADSLVERLRDVTMLKAPEIKVYRNAFVSLEHIGVQHLSPPQNYILREELKKVRELKWALAEHGIDIFRSGWFCEADAGRVRRAGGSPAACGGRVHRARRKRPLPHQRRHAPRVHGFARMGHPASGAVRGVPKDFPYYAFPVPGGWASVEERDDLPHGYLKKWHRISNYHAFYRNFNSAFSNVGGPREFHEKART